MIRAAAIVFALSAPAQADVLICEFTPQDCETCEDFTITINTHHGADTPRFEYGGVDASIMEVPEGGVDAPSFLTLGAADREIITLFNGFDAIHTQHYTEDSVPMARTAIGRCTSFY